MSDDRSVPFIFDDQSPEKKHYDFRFALPPPTVPSPQPMDVDTSGPIRLPEESAPAVAVHITSKKKRKLNNGKVKPKIRKLTSDDSEGNGCSPGTLRRLLSIRSLLFGSLAVTVAVMLAVVVQEDLRKDFYKKYKKQYQLLLYGIEDYCSQELDMTNVTVALERRVVGQEAAIAQIAGFFDRHRHSQASSLVLIGPVGVGKSLMADVITANFQWRLNVHRYRWSSGLTAKRQFSKFQSFLHSLRHETSAPTELACGHNLFIIDQLEASDVELVNKINVRLRMVADRDELQLTALYLFRGSFVADVDDIERLEADIERVVLRPLDEEDLKRCIHQEAAEMGIDLDQSRQLLEQVVKSVDVHRHGCKGVRAKLSLHAQNLRDVRKEL
ncbi:uncharacterized protein LOC129725568 [Wyeomyia smithii]|uniref:uncharacterized protein LOC129725568 n=1 Tax=Wyeomyia smithii TaxID=174621 RepID=UPI002467C88C|nr:uncharacterized protein LOC129725568 [Wyeomyia smithii]